MSATKDHAVDKMNRTAEIEDIAVYLQHLSDALHRFPSTQFRLGQINAKLDKLARISFRCGLVCTRGECCDTSKTEEQL